MAFSKSNCFVSSFKPALEAWNLASVRLHSSFSGGRFGAPYTAKGSLVSLPLRYASIGSFASKRSRHTNHILGLRKLSTCATNLACLPPTPFVVAEDRAKAPAEGKSHSSEHESLRKAGETCTLCEREPTSGHSLQLSGVSYSACTKCYSSYYKTWKSSMQRQVRTLEDFISHRRSGSRTQLKGGIACQSCGIKPDADADRLRTRTVFGSSFTVCHRCSIISGNILRRRYSHLYSCLAEFIVMARWRRTYPRRHPTGLRFQELKARLLASGYSGVPYGIDDPPRPSLNYPPQIR